MGLPLPVAMGIWLVIGLGLLVIMVVGYRRRRAASARLVPTVAQATPGPAGAGSPSAPALGEPTFGPVAATYVSTTRSGDWLARVDTPELGQRSRGHVSVHPGGVLIDRPGPGPLLIAPDDLVATGTASGMAGKFVGRQGLDVLTWRSPDGVVLDTGLRLAHRADRDALRTAVDALRTDPASPAPTSSTAPHDPNEKESL